MRAWSNPKDPEAGKFGKALRKYAVAVICIGIPAALWFLGMLAS